MTSSALLGLWETCARRTTAERGLLMLEFLDRDPTAVTVGERESHLARLYESLFGRTLRGVATCPACAERIECDLDARAFRQHEEPFAVTVRQDGWAVTAQRLSAQDVADSSRLPSVEAASAFLVSRAITDCTFNESAAPISEIPEELLMVVASELDAADPLSEVTIQATCPACGAEMGQSIDITTFLWEQLNRWASQMLREVHVLAREYGWSEADILTMSTARRGVYLRMVEA